MAETRYIQAILSTLYEDTLKQPNIGNVADYILALAKVYPEQAALTVVTIDGNAYFVENNFWSRINMGPSDQFKPSHNYGRSRSIATVLISLLNHYFSSILSLKNYTNFGHHANFRKYSYAKSTLSCTVIDVINRLWRGKWLFFS